MAAVISCWWPPLQTNMTPSINPLAPLVAASRPAPNPNSAPELCDSKEDELDRFFSAHPTRSVPGPVDCRAPRHGRASNSGGELRAAGRVVPRYG